MLQEQKAYPKQQKGWEGIKIQQPLSSRGCSASSDYVEVAWDGPHQMAHPAPVQPAALPRTEGQSSVSRPARFCCPAVRIFKGAV